MSFKKALLISFSIFVIYILLTGGTSIFLGSLSGIEEEPIVSYRQNENADTSISDAVSYLVSPEPEGTLGFMSELPDDTGRTQKKTYKWMYKTYECSIYPTYDTDIYEYYSTRSRNREYSSFITDPYDDKLIESLADSLTNLASKMDLPDSELPYLCISFVQSLPYTSDSVSSGYDEYPRFPYETLYYGGGDCEDTSILSAALLNELGYGVVFIELPGHAAIGIKGADDLSGSYYTYEGHRYYYLETTNTGWEVGELPDEYDQTDAKITPIYKKPELLTTFDATVSSNGKADYVDVVATVTNVGSTDANNVEIYVALQTESEDTVYSHITSESLPEIPPAISVTYTVANLKAKSGDQYRIFVQAKGDNVVSEPSYSEWNY